MKPVSLRLISLVVVAAAMVTATASMISAKEYKSGIKWQQPPIVDPGDAQKAPSDAIVLFDGKNMDAFDNGDKASIEDGAFVIGPGGVRSKQAFGDIQLHLEFATPSEVKGEGQGRGNSGVYLMGKYEVQILDSYENETYYDGQAAAVYKQSPPLVNASRPPGVWQTYDIIFNAPRFTEQGEVERPASVTVLHNGMLVQNHFVLEGGTSFVAPPSYKKHPEKLPFNLQFHGNPVRFRNIWVREIKPLEKTLPGEAERTDSPANAEKVEP